MALNRCGRCKKLFLKGAAASGTICPECIEEAARPKPEKPPAQEEAKPEAKKAPARLIELACPWCEQSIKVPIGLVGNDTTCPSCAKAFTVPESPGEVVVRTKASKPSVSVAGQGFLGRFHRQLVWAAGVVGLVLVIILVLLILPKSGPDGKE